mgnify:CR=1 FL=1
MNQLNHQCRVCAKFLIEPRLLHFKNMPKAAQFLPGMADLAEDQGIDLDVYQCGSCGLIQIINEPVSYYKEVVRAAAFSEEMKAFRQQQFSRFVQEYTLQGRKLIEIGCGCGEYLTLLQEAGVNAYGLEASEASVNQCVKNNLQVTCGYVDCADYIIQGGGFDAFVTLNFLEHWPDPNASLSGIAHNLCEGGIGLIEVPNFEMILRKNLFTEFISDHIFYFTRETLETTLRLNGFEIIKCSEIWYDYILSAVVRKRSLCNVSSFDHIREQLKIEIHKYIQQYGENGVAIWGAGHQALATISLLGLADEIKYVVDSAPFKQNKFTPVSHIPIVAPESLNGNPVDAIIVMAASYSDEVAKVARERLGNKSYIAILRDYGLEPVL